MDTATIERCDIMTDYQFKSIIKMAVNIVDEAKDKKDASKKLRNLLPEKERDTFTQTHSTEQSE
ncbi:MAG: hypothetical protein FWF76_06075 [Oscillospiraceae bacterium]|nr:hypothetical protein [Oscillospiraceae bacterium]